MDVDTIITAISGILAQDEPPKSLDDLAPDQYDTFVRLPEHHAGRVPPEGQALYWMTRAHYHEYQSSIHHESLVATEKELTARKIDLEGRVKEIADRDREIAEKSKAIESQRKEIANRRAEHVRRRKEMEAIEKSIARAMADRGPTPRDAPHVADNDDDDYGDDDDYENEDGDGHLGNPTSQAGPAAGPIPAALSAVKEREVMPPKLKTVKAKDWIAFKQSFLNHRMLNGWTERRALGILAVSLEEDALTAVAHLYVRINACATLQAGLQLYEEVFIHRSGTHLARTEFNQATRAPSETLQTWHTRLRVLFMRAFPNPADQIAEPQGRALRERFVFGMGMPAIGEKLVYHENFYDYTYVELLHRAQDIQAIQAQLRSNRPQVQHVSTSHSTSSGGAAPSGQSGQSREEVPCGRCGAIRPSSSHPCARCGASDHWKDECKGDPLPDWAPGKRRRRKGKKKNQENDRKVQEVTPAGAPTTAGN